MLTSTKITAGHLSNFQMRSARFWAASIGKADGGRDGAATTVPPFVDPSGRNGNERRETEKFIWQIFIFVPLSLLSKSSFHLDRGREGKVNRIWPGCFLLTVMPRKGGEKHFECG